MLLRGRQRATIYTLGNRLAEQPFALIRNEVELDRASTRTLPIDGNLMGVSAEISNVFLDPFKSLDLIKEACVEVAVGRISERRRCEEAERGESVVYRDDDDFGTLVNPVIKGPVLGVAVGET